jgi:glycosyltransferase involved in cell wall biosynthesis
MMQIHLSIILPCYNVEKYIVACLDSLYQQDIPEEEYEVICVNDCSPDGTRDLIIKYQQKHANLYLIEHEVNKKQGGARNSGLKVAKGEYVWFVDPDDFIKPNVSKQLLEICVKNNLDILLFNYDKVSSSGEFKFKKENVSNNEVTTGIEFINSLGINYLNDYDLSVWSRIVKTDFFRKNNIKFIENTILEDLEFSLRTLILSGRIKTLSDSFYCYRYNENSTMSELNRQVKGEFIYQTCLVVGKGIIDLADDIKNIDLNISNMLYLSGVWRVNRITKPILKASIKERKVFYNLLKKNRDFKISILGYLNSINKILVNYGALSKLFLFIISPVLNLVRRS